MKIGISVLDRIENSFILFFKDFKTFKNIFLAYFLYKFFIVIIFGNLFYFLILKYLNFNIVNSDNLSGILGELFGSTEFIIGVNIFLVLVLINLILIIPFILGTIKTIKDVYEEKEDINYLKNIKYGFKNLNNSFKTYWYIFVYVGLIPSILFILSGILFVFGYKSGDKSLSELAGKLLIFSLIIFIIFAIYRGLKTSFSIVSAVDSNEYTKQNFEKSIKITDNNWWRILGNFLLVGLIISILSSIANSIIGILNIGGHDLSGLNILKSDNINSENLINLLKESLGNFSFFSIIIDILKLVIDVLGHIFILIFTYLFFKRLEFEKNNIGYNSFVSIKNEKSVIKKPVEL